MVPFSEKSIKFLDFVIYIFSNIASDAILKSLLFDGGAKVLHDYYEIIVQFVSPYSIVC